MDLQLGISVLAACANIVAIYGIFHTRKNEDIKRDMSIEKNFVQVNMKLDEFSRDMSELVRKSESEHIAVSEMQKSFLSQSLRLEQQEKTIATLQEKVNLIEDTIISRKE